MTGTLIQLAEENPTLARAGNAGAAIQFAVDRGLDFLASLQAKDGSWRGDYGGPMFLPPMYVAACHIAGRRIPEVRRQGLISYMQGVQNPDGSIGLHEEDDGSMFTTALTCVALRLLGVAQDDAGLARMRAWVLDNGTALGAASWGKFILALLNLYPYEGLNPILPELWLLPRAAPIHPGRLWCHCRQVYLPMSYLYATKARIEESELVAELRRDLYNQPYDQIDFSRHRDNVASSDNRFPISLPLRAVNVLQNAFERRHNPALRSRAIEEVYRHICYEDKATNYIDIGPVNSVLNTIVHCFRDPGGPRVKKSFAALDGYLWETPAGTKVNGYNSTALWDTAFSAQAILSTGLGGRYADTLRAAFGYIKNNQILKDTPEHDSYHRHRCRGGWPFSNRAHGWPITDCTSEGFKSAVELEKFTGDSIDEDLLADSVKLILSFQNGDGGWSSYERQRGGAWLELLNPSQVFGDIMVDYSYVECTSACMQALVRAKTRFAGRFDAKIDRALRRGADFIKKRQRADGSWEGSWAVCFTYGTWFGTWGLLAAGAPENAPELRRACGFLIGRQNPDGGWGEDWRSCTRRRYIRSTDSRAVNTAWALLSLSRCGLATTAPARRAAYFLLERQLASGDWPQEPLVGVFNKTTLINYENYRRYFPIWALAEYARRSSNGHARTT
ncbi:MAG TPA: terpene cyclase/mutase family protein [Myxococcota bacterium]|nr:terpene cyclase/mutase family protein [Myxococcota bacterium]